MTAVLPETTRVIKSMTAVLSETTTIRALNYSFGFYVFPPSIFRRLQSTDTQWIAFITGGKSRWISRLNHGPCCP
jgi:hypothetical protein